MRGPGGAWAQTIASSMTRENVATELGSGPECIARAVQLLREGEVVGLPTETVYGLGADALQPEAVAKIFEAKERPYFDPLIVHLPSVDWLERLTDVPASSRALVGRLMEAFWPGPLTLVLPRRPLVPDLVTSGLDSVAIRMSAHPVFQAVATAFGGPLAAPSANRFGRISPTCAEDVRKELDGRIPLIVDGGPTEHGIESTIVAVEGTALRILRSGPITADRLAQFGEVRMAGTGQKIESPGQLKSHYAPRTPMSLGDVAGGGKNVGLLAWTGAGHGFGAIEILSATGDLREAAATLFAKMRRLDEAGLERIVAQPVPEHGLGIAIMDRLRKASYREG